MKGKEEGGRKEVGGAEDWTRQGIEHAFNVTTHG